MNNDMNFQDPNVNSPLMQYNNFDMGQPMVPQEPVQMNESTEMNSNKPKGTKGLMALFAVLLLAAGVAVGYFVPKLFSKKDNTDTKLEEKKNEPENPKTDEEKPVEEPTKEPEPEPEKEPEKEEPKAEEPKEEKKEYKIKRSNVVKEDSQNVKLNGVTYKLETVYFKKDKNILKDVYFNGVNIIKGTTLWVRPDSKRINTLISNDIDLTKETVTTLNDTKSKDQYLVYYNSNEFEWGGAEDEDWFEHEVDVHVVNKDGKVLYQRWTYVSVHGEWLVIKDKKDVLDREYRSYECADYEEEDEEYGQYCNGYVLYDGPEYTEDDFIKGYNVEFMEDHFYAYESGYYGYVVKTKFNYTGDYKYYIENGTLKKTKLNSSNGWVTGAGES